MVFALSSLSTVTQALRGKSRFHGTSQRWASLVLLASSIFIVGSTAVTSYWLVRQIIIDSLKTNAQLSVEKARDEIDQWLATRSAEVETLANQVAIRSMHLEAVIPFLSLEADRLPDYRYLMYAYPDGSHYRTDRGFSQDQTLVKSAYFKAAIAGKVQVSGLERTDANAHRQISVAAPIWSVPPLNRKISADRAALRAENLYAFGLPSDPYQTPKPIGALVGVIPTKHIEDVVNSIPKVPGSYAFVLDGQGMPLVKPMDVAKTPGAAIAPQTGSMLNASDPAWQTIYQTMVHNGQGVQRVKLGNEWVYVAYVPLQQAQWSLALVIPKAHVEQKLDALNTLAWVVAGVLAIASFIALQQIRLLEQAEERSTELQQEVLERQRAEAALRESQGQLEARVADRTAELAAANQVLQTSETQLKQQAQELATALQELQQTQAQLVQTEKMSSLGQMVAGIAHEINNPVNFIHANLPYADQYLNDLIQLIKTYQMAYPQPNAAVQDVTDSIDIDFVMEDLPKILESMHIGTDRIRQLVLSLRNFSRLDEADMKQVDIHEGLDSTLLILQNRLKAKSQTPGIRVVKDYENSHLVECYAGQLNQVFMNILANAIDALEDKLNKAMSQSPTEQWHHSPLPGTGEPEPTIWIRTQAIATNWVEIRIADNASGMPPEVCAKVFDPFFTTKAVGKGTGIGLSISYQIVVEKHGGQLQCFSTVGEGTEFVIRIPVHPQATKVISPDVARSPEVTASTFPSAPVAAS